MLFRSSKPSSQRKSKEGLRTSRVEHIKELTGQSLSSLLRTTDDISRWATIVVEASAGLPQRRLGVKGISNKSSRSQVPIYPLVNEIAGYLLDCESARCINKVITTVAIQSLNDLTYFARYLVADLEIGERRKSVHGISLLPANVLLCSFCCQFSTICNRLAEI